MIIKLSQEDERLATQSNVEANSVFRVVLRNMDDQVRSITDSGGHVMPLHREKCPIVFNGVRTKGITFYVRFDEDYVIEVSKRTIADLQPGVRSPIEPLKIGMHARCVFDGDKVLLEKYSATIAYRPGLIRKYEDYLKVPERLWGKKLAIKVRNHLNGV